MNKYVWMKYTNRFDIKGFLFILTISILLVLNTFSMMKTLVQAQSSQEGVMGADESHDIASSSKSGDLELEENKSGGAAGSIEFAMNTEQSASEQKFKIMNPEDNKKTINTADNNPDAIDVLVNKDYKLPEDYEPQGLVTPNVKFAPGSFNKEMREEAARALEELFSAAAAEGITLYAVSGYRSYAYQQTLFQSNINIKGSIEAANIYSARPGESEHQTGLAMDVTSQSAGYSLTEEFGKTPEGKWVRDNAHKYGFILRYLPGKEHITGYAYEPWHIRYLGVELATAVYESGLTYEEYLEK